MIELDTTKFLLTTGASIMILFGVVSANTGEQYPALSSAKSLGMLLFIAGWVFMALALGYRKRNSYIYWIPAILILISVMILKSQIPIKTSAETKKRIMAISAGAFILSWVAIGYFVGDNIGNNNIKYLGYLASALVISSMMYLLPWQRKNGVVDGPGYAMFTIAWFIIIILNSYKNISFD